MKTNKKLTPKESVMKSLETRFNNLKKKLTAKTIEYRDAKKVIYQEMQIINIQLQALKKK